MLRGRRFRGWVLLLLLVASLLLTAGSTYLASNTVAPSNAGQVTVIGPCFADDQGNQGNQGNQGDQGNPCDEGNQGNRGDQNPGDQGN